MSQSTDIVAAFDLDGTFIRGNSMTEYLRLIHSRRMLFEGALRLGPVLGAYQMGRIPRREAKERVLDFFFGGMEMAFLEEKGVILAEKILPRKIRPKALIRLKWHQEQGHRCILVTASLSFWTHAFAQKYGLELIATLPEVSAGRFTGRLLGPNNYGPEKVNRLDQLIPLDQVNYLYAYGDTAGDRELLARADEGLYRPFH
ncbi:MAG: HAD family hydrolase [Bacteroidota bacterium]